MEFLILLKAQKNAWMEEKNELGWAWLKDENRPRISS